MERCDVLYLLSMGFAARTVLQTDVAPRLTEAGLKVAVLTSHGGAASVEAECQRLGIEVHEAPALSGASLIQEQMLRRYLTEDFRANKALWANHLRAARDPSPRKRARALWYSGLGRLARAVPAIRRRYEARLKGMLASPELTDLIGRIQPRVVVSTYPVAPMEAAALLAAQKAGIETVGQILSWDNITTKGRFTVIPDRFLSWGPIMTEELEEHYGIQGERVVECGVAHFDAHARPVPPGRLAESLRGAGLDPELPYLLFAMSSPFFFPREIDVVERLAGWVSEGRFGAIQLLVRPHPQNVTGAMADLTWLPRLEAIKGARVGIDYPRLGPQGLSWSLDDSDLPHLAAIVQGCAISINSGSTMAIDSLMRDRPVILTPFDADDRSIPWHESGRRAAEYPHLVKLIETRACGLAASFEDLEREISADLADPSRRAADRERARMRECGPADGQAGKRIADAITAWAKEAE